MNQTLTKEVMEVRQPRGTESSARHPAQARAGIFLSPNSRPNITFQRNSLPALNHLCGFDRNAL